MCRERLVDAVAFPGRGKWKPSISVMHVWVNSLRKSDSVLSPARFNLYPENMEVFGCSQLQNWQCVSRSSEGIPAERRGARDNLGSLTGVGGSLCSHNVQSKAITTCISCLYTSRCRHSCDKLLQCFHFCKHWNTIRGETCTWTPAGGGFSHFFSWLL